MSSALSFSTVALEFKFRSKGNRVFIDAVRFDGPDQPFYLFAVDDRVLERHTLLKKYLATAKIDLKGRNGTQIVRLPTDQFLDYWCERKSSFKFNSKTLLADQSGSPHAYSVDQEPIGWLKVSLICFD